MQNVICINIIQFYYSFSWSILESCNAVYFELNMSAEDVDIKIALISYVVHIQCLLLATLLTCCRNGFTEQKVIGN